MKALTYTKYGAPEVVSLTDVAKPSPKPNEVLVRIHATTITSGDWRARSLDLPSGMGLIGRLVFGIFGPRQNVLGSELAGVVEAVGADVSTFKIGERVFAFAGAKMGAHAEYRTIAEDGMIAHIPNNLGFEEAAALPFGGTTALNFLKKKGGIKASDKVLIVGASGSVGSAAVQIAKYFGAEVTGVTSTPNLKLVAALGADHVIDYKKVDFATNGETYDLIMDTTGTTPIARVEGSLKAGGRLLIVNGSLKQLLGLEKAKKASGKKVISGVAAERPEDIRFLAQLAANGDFKPLIDSSYPLEHAVEAHAYVDTGRKRGNVVLTVSKSPSLSLAAE